MRATVLLVGLLLLTAGCLGIGGDDADDEASPSPQDTDTNTTPSGNTSATEDHDHEPAPEKHYENRTGEVTGVGILVGSINSVGNETFAVPEGTQSLAITVVAEGGELNIDVLPPECTDEAEIAGVINTGPPSCAESSSTSNDTGEQLTPNGGTFEFSTQSPEGGNWTVEMSKDDTGNNAVSYTVQTVYVDVHEPGADHHS